MFPARSGALSSHQKVCNMRSHLVSGLVLAAVFVAFPAAPASAQVLIWSLPKEDGTWVRFEGTYKQTRNRPDAKLGDEMLEWRSELTISVVGSETAEFTDKDADGKDRLREVPCRWVEFKSQTKPGGLDIPAGPGDTFRSEERRVGKEWRGGWWRKR